MPKKESTRSAVSMDTGLVTDGQTDTGRQQTDNSALAHNVWRVKISET